MGSVDGLESDISALLKKHGVRNVIRLKLDSSVDVVNVLKLLINNNNNNITIVTILPPDSGDDLLWRIRENFPEITVVAYRSFSLKDEVLIAF